MTGEKYDGRQEYYHLSVDSGIIGIDESMEVIIDMIRRRVEWIAPFYVYPGTLEMEALAAGALHDLDGTIPAKEYVRAW